MKTTQNSLSVWSIDNEDQIDEAVLAIVSGHQHLDSFDIVCLSKDKLQEEGIDVIHAPGGTPIGDLTDRHFHIYNLTYCTLGKVARLVVNSFSQNTVKRYTRGNLKKLLQHAINSGRLAKNNINSAIASKL
jgi:hypothetical protein